MLIAEKSGQLKLVPNGLERRAADLRQRRRGQRLLGPRAARRGGGLELHRQPLHLPALHGRAEPRRPRQQRADGLAPHPLRCSTPNNTSSSGDHDPRDVLRRHLPGAVEHAGLPSLRGRLTLDRHRPLRPRRHALRRRRATAPRSHEVDPAGPAHLQRAEPVGEDHAHRPQRQWPGDPPVLPERHQPVGRLHQALRQGLSQPLPLHPAPQRRARRRRRRLEHPRGGQRDLLRRQELRLALLRGHDPHPRLPGPGPVRAGVRQGGRRQRPRRAGLRLPPPAQQRRDRRPYVYGLDLPGVLPGQGLLRRLRRGWAQAHERRRLGRHPLRLGLGGHRHPAGPRREHRLRVLRHARQLGRLDPRGLLLAHRPLAGRAGLGDPDLGLGAARGRLRRERLERPRRRRAHLHLGLRRRSHRHRRQAVAHLHPERHVHGHRHRRRRPAGARDTATTTVSVGNDSPLASIVAPDDWATATAQTIQLHGSATDAEDGALPASAYSWDVTLHHQDHTHPIVQPVRTKSTDLPGGHRPRRRLLLRDHPYRVTDSGGVRPARPSRSSVPRPSPSGSTSSPAGAPISYGGPRLHRAVPRARGDRLQDHRSARPTASSAAVAPTSSAAGRTAARGSTTSRCRPRRPPSPPPTRRSGAGRRPAGRPASARLRGTGRPVSRSSRHRPPPFLAGG